MRRSFPPPARNPAAPRPVRLLADADATRSAHLAAMVRDGTVWKLAGAAVGSALLFGALERDADALVFGLLASPVLTALALVAIADWRASVDFFKAYASARGLSHSERGELMPLTPLLGAGARRGAVHLMRGSIPGCGRQGTVALYTYETRNAIADGDGRDDDYTPHHFTVCLLDLPEAFPRFAGVYLTPRNGAGKHDWLGGRGLREVGLESIEFERIYRLRMGDDQDPGAVRELFSPALMVRLIEERRSLGLELGAGGLCVFTPGKVEDAAGLDAFLSDVADLAGDVERELTEGAMTGRLAPSA